MKHNKWIIFMLAIICAIGIIVGCEKREQTKEEVYSDFQKKISKMNSYTCTAEIIVKGNKSESNYIIKHTYKKPEYYKLEVISPERLSGKTMEYNKDKILITNPDINDSIELPNVDNDKQYLFVGDFIKNYLQNEEVNITFSGNNILIETSIPGEDKYFSTQILYVDKNTKKPDKMEILDKEGITRFTVNYKDFKYKG